jgi:predicted MFS family arabinose efflux permease
MTPAIPAARLARLGMCAILAVIAVAMAVISWFALAQANRALTYETLRNAESVARSLAATFDRAAELDIPLAEMPGVNEKLEEVRAQHPGLSRISVVVSGDAKFTARAPGVDGIAETMVESVPIQLAGGTSELLEVAVDPRFITQLFRELALDFVVILVVAGFITLELIYFLAGPIIVSPLRLIAECITRLSSGSLAGPVAANYPGAMRDVAFAIRRHQDALLADYRDARTTLRQQLAARRAQSKTDSDLKQALQQRVQQLRAIRDRFGLKIQSSREVVQDPASALGRMRAPFFLLLLAEDLSRSFLPIYAGSMDVGPLDLSPNLIVGLPIFLFMLIVAISQPVLGGWSERLGRRNAFLVGAAIAVAAHLLAAQASTLLGLLAWRAAAGVAWAIAFVAAQGIVLDHTDKVTRAKGLAGFVTVIMVSLACGPSVGGLLADGIGFRATFVIAAAMAALALVVAWRSLPADIARAPTIVLVNVADATARLHPLTNWRFVGLLLLAAVPAKLILVAYCYYLIPLYLTASGNSAAMAGRIIMIYSVVMVMLVPVAAGWIDRARQRAGVAPHAWFVAVGIALSGLGGLAMLVPNEIAGAALLVTILGFAQAISISPQAAMVPDLTRAEIARRGETAIYGYYRLVERVGSALGPIVAAAILQLASFRESFVVLGIIVFGCGATFAWLYALPSRAARDAANAANGKMAASS